MFGVIHRVWDQRLAWILNCKHFIAWSEVRPNLLCVNWQSHVFLDHHIIFSPTTNSRTILVMSELWVALSLGILDQITLRISRLGILQPSSCRITNRVVCVIHNIVLLVPILPKYMLPSLPFIISVADLPLVWKLSSLRQRRQIRLILNENPAGVTSRSVDAI